MSNVLQLPQYSEAEFERLLRETKQELNDWLASINISMGTVTQIENLELAGKGPEAMRLLKQLRRLMA